MKQKRYPKIVSLVATIVLLFCMVLPYTASAAETSKVISLDNSGGDDNPFIRCFPNKQLCGTGGPFTVSFDIKIESFRRLAGRDSYSVFVNMMHADTGHKMQGMKSWQTNIDWTKVSFSFSNINATLIDGVMQPYALIDIGVIYAKAVVSIRDFKIVNAAGNTVYSIDTDADLNGITDLRNIGQNNPEPFLLNAAFGNSGNAKYPISAGSSVTVSTTKPPVYETDPPTTTTNSPTTNTSINPTADTGSTGVTSATDTDTSETDMTEQPTEDATIETQETTNTTSSQQTGTKVIKKVNWPVVIALIVGGVACAAAAVYVVLMMKRKKDQNGGSDK